MAARAQGALAIDVQAPYDFGVKSGFGSNRSFAHRAAGVALVHALPISQLTADG